MKPKLIEDKWYIEVYTEEFGNVLLLKKEEYLPIPISFNTEEEAINHIKSIV